LEVAGSLSPVDLTETLTALQGWLGREVEVSVSGADGKYPLLAAELRGTLRRPDYLSLPLSQSPVQEDTSMFVIEDDQGQQIGPFFLAETALRGAEWWPATRRRLRIGIGVVDLLVSPVVQPSDA
jgi:hypothetical protein